MKITIHFHDGPLDVEIHTSEEEDYQDVLENLSEFLEGYSPAYEPTRFEGDEGESGSVEPTVSDNIPDISDISSNELSRVVKLGQVENGEIKELPRIIGDISKLGDSGQEKLVHGSTVILALLDEFHGVDTIKTSELKQALADSGLNIDNWKNISQVDDEEIYLNRRGRGNSATTELRPPGKDIATELINSLLDKED